MIGTRPTELTLTLAPQRRFEAIDVNRRIAREAGDILRRHRRALYTSFHTTAGYLDQSLSVRLHHRHDLVSQFFRAFHALFPQGGEYRHDQMHLRSELSDAQKVVEPRNGDSHLTFIGAGMRNCVTYRSRPDAPVYFIRSEEHTSELQSQSNLVCRLLLEKKKQKITNYTPLQNSKLLRRRVFLSCSLPLYDHQDG